MFGIFEFGRVIVVGFGPIDLRSLFLYPILRSQFGILGIGGRRERRPRPPPISVHVNSDSEHDRLDRDRSTNPENRRSIPLLPNRSTKEVLGRAGSMAIAFLGWVFKNRSTKKVAQKRSRVFPPPPSVYVGATVLLLRRRLVDIYTLGFGDRIGRWLVPSSSCWFSA